MRIAFMATRREFLFFSYVRATYISLHISLFLALLNLSSCMYRVNERRKDISVIHLTHDLVTLKMCFYFFK